VATPLTSWLAGQILDDVQAHGRRVGDHLIEEELAEKFRVSRSPIRKALQILRRNRLVTFRRGAGFFLTRGADEIDRRLNLTTLVVEEDVYGRIVEDHARGAVPRRFSEASFIGRYHISRVKLAKVLARMQEEGWVERLPGHGWCFSPGLDTLEVLDQSFRFRMVIEPAAILEPTFQVDAAAFAWIRAEHRAIGTRVQRKNAFELFSVTSGFHETLVRCSHNRFYVEAFQRVTRVRRVMEYRWYQTIPDPDRPRRLQEHLTMLDLIEAGDRQAAAALLRAHLDAARRDHVERGSSGT
jgi:DNA-binding GntR family transcriptional regulator